MKRAHKQMKGAHKQMKGAHKDDCGMNLFCTKVSDGFAYCAPISRQNINRCYSATTFWAKTSYSHGYSVRNIRAALP